MLRIVREARRLASLCNSLAISDVLHSPHIYGSDAHHLLSFDLDRTDNTTAPSLGDLDHERSRHPTVYAPPAQIHPAFSHSSKLCPASVPNRFLSSLISAWSSFPASSGSSSHPSGISSAASKGRFSTFEYVSRKNPPPNAPPANISFGVTLGVKMPLYGASNSNVPVPSWLRVGKGARFSRDDGERGIDGT